MIQVVISIWRLNIFLSIVFYKNDSFGLKTTDQLNKWKKITIRGVKHEHWIRNGSIISTCILPYLT